METVGLLMFGAAVGYYGTLVGIGGGPLLIPVLMMFFHLPPATVVATSISVVFLNALSGSLAYYSQRRIDLVSGTLFGVLAIPASLVAYFLVARVSHDTFQKVFGVFLLCLAGYVLVGSAPGQGRKTEPRTNAGGGFGLSQRRLVDAQGRVFCFAINEWLGGFINVLFGFATSLLGIGGGILQVPMLIFVLRMPIHIATATAHYITAINAGFSLLPLLFFGHADPRLTLLLGSGVVAGARLGARHSSRFRGKTLVRMLAVVFVVAGIWLLRE